MRVAAMASNQVLPLLAKCLQRGFAGAAAADVCHSDGVPSLLGSSFLKKRELHLGRDCSNEGIQRPSILVVIDVAVPNWLPHVPHLEPYPHHRSPLDVVDLGEGRPPAAGTDVPDNVLDSMVTMVPVRGGRAVLPIRAAISDNPAAGASAPIRAAATAPLGVRGCPLRRLLPRCLPRRYKQSYRCYRRAKPRALPSPHALHPPHSF
jgi:hypothetical protein